MKIYLVGGAVRDRLLELPVTDRDWVVVGATVDEMLAAGYRLVGADFPVFLHPESGEEFALARTERKTAPGYKGFSINASPEVTLEEDLLRRDLTINAIAEDSQGNIIDPYGGVADLRAGILRHVSDAFLEDPLRVLRVARFAARYAGLGFRIAGETHHLMQQLADSGELSHLVPERAWHELEKALSEEHPAVFIQILRDCHALAAVLPEVEQLFGVPQPEAHHPEVDTGIHTLMSLRQATMMTPSPEVRFATLCHDLGKGTTDPADWPQHHGHEARGAELVDTLCQRLRAPRAFRDLAVLVARYHTQCHSFDSLRPGTQLKLLEALDAFRRPQRVAQFLTACEADARGRRGFETRPYPQAEQLRQTLAAANSVEPRQVIADLDDEERRNGERIRQRLFQRRVQAIREAAARSVTQDEV